MSTKTETMPKEARTNREETEPKAEKPEQQGLTYTFAAQLTKAGHEKLDRLLEMNFQLYNAALKHRRAAYYFETEKDKKYINEKDQGKEFTMVRDEDPEWESQDRRIGVETLKRLEKSYKAFRKNLRNGIPFQDAGRPRYRKLHEYRTLDIHSSANRYLRTDRPGRYRIQIKGVPPIRFRSGSRTLPDTQPRQIRVVRKERRIEVQLVYMFDTPPVNEQTGAGLGIDVNVRNQLTTSDGMVLPSRVINRDRTVLLSQEMAQIREKALADGRAHMEPRKNKQRARFVWNSKTPSAQYRKVRKSFAKEWEKITEKERNYAHRVTTAIIDSMMPGEIVSVENLNIHKMLKNEYLARRISEQGWGRIIQHLEYKANLKGVPFRKVEPQDTTQECSRCGAYVYKAPSATVHHCPECNLKMNQDENAAINILKRGVMGDDYKPAIRGPQDPGPPVPRAEAPSP